MGTHQSTQEDALFTQFAYPIWQTGSVVRQFQRGVHYNWEIKTKDIGQAWVVSRACIEESQDWQPKYLILQEPGRLKIQVYDIYRPHVLNQHHKLINL